MPTSASFQSTYLTPGAPNAIVGPERFRVAGALYRLQEQLRMGATGAQAQAQVYTAERRRRDDIDKARGKTPAGGTLVTDFQAVDSL